MSRKAGHEFHKFLLFNSCSSPDLHKKIYVSSVTTQGITVLWHFSSCCFSLAEDNWLSCPVSIGKSYISCSPKAGRQLLICVAAQGMKGHCLFWFKSSSSGTSAAILRALQGGDIPLIIRYQGNIDGFPSLPSLICCFPHLKHPKSREEREQFSPEVSNHFCTWTLSLPSFLQKEMASN